jgi:P27 family predicted phage terminase small subunit
MAGKPGRSGRKRKPKTTLRLHGTYREDRHGGAIPDPPTAIPTPPKSLKGIALEEWDRVTKLLAEINCIAELDRALLTAYCVEWRTYMTADNRLRLSRSLMATSTKGTQMAHPLLRVRDRAFANLMRICGEFGFSTASRSRLSIEAKAAGEDPLERLIRDSAEMRAAARGGRAG